MTSKLAIIRKLLLIISLAAGVVFVFYILAFFFDFSIDRHAFDIPILALVFLLISLVICYLVLSRHEDEWFLMKNSLLLFKKKVSIASRLNGTIFMVYDRTKRFFIRLDESGDTILHYIYLKDWLPQFYPEDLHIGKELLGVLDEGKMEQYHTEYRYKFPDRYCWFSIDVSPYESGAGNEILSYICIVRSIDKEKLEMQEMIYLRDKAEAANKMKTLFIQSVSHEVRTPLNAIIGFSGLICEGASAEGRQDYIKYINDNSKQLLSIVDNMLLLSDAESGLVTVNKQTFDFEQFFKALADTLKVRMHKKLDFICLSGGPASIISDDEIIKDILGILVSNAEKFTDTGSITMRYEVTEKDIKISVIDTGIGISKEAQEALFRLFEKANKFSQGAGLGLALCSTMVRLLGGKIGVNSELGKGSTFWFSIPK
ncbi:MAG: HAMP domain-containing histidine kinase [Bacteroidales bacterium]|jgi:signal transduction histidine kinase|nr:HAMP domain-containing histidine kinase [Bacteroidales bacterium]MCI1733068.1 HAMP domain-containing histidine kinase [Bacteroidales bacterium]